MNNSEYLQYLQHRMGKVGESGMKFLNARGLDRAFGESQMRRGFNLEDIGREKNIQERRLGLAQSQAENRATRLSQDYDRAVQNYDTSKDAFKGAESDMKTAHVFDLMGLGTGFLQGQNQAEKEREVAEMLRRQTAAIEGMTR